MKKSNSLIKSILASGGKDILTDMGDISLESITKNETVDRIPEIGWLKIFITSVELK